VICASHNPSVRGYLAEELCLQVIADKGLCTIGEEGPRGSLPKEFFNNDKPNWNTLIDNDQHDCHLYLPSQFNYTNIDAAILHIKSRKSKDAHLYLIQVTLAKKHKDSEMLFYQKQWQDWVHDLESNKWTLNSTFVWIDLKQPDEQLKQKKVLGLRSRDAEVHPEYTHRRVGLTSLDPRFERLVMSMPGQG